MNQITERETVCCTLSVHVVSEKRPIDIVESYCHSDVVTELFCDVSDDDSSRWCTVDRVTTNGGASDIPTVLANKVALCPQQL